MPSAFVLVAALAVSPQQPPVSQDAIAIAVATRNRHAVETMLAQDPTLRGTVARQVRKQLGIDPALTELRPKHLEARREAQRQVAAGMRILLSAAQDGAPSQQAWAESRACFRTALGHDLHTATALLLGHAVNLPDEDLGTSIAWAVLDIRDAGRRRGHVRAIANLAPIAALVHKRGLHGQFAAATWVRELAEERRLPREFAAHLLEEARAILTTKGGLSLWDSNDEPCFAGPLRFGRLAYDWDGEAVLAAACFDDAQIQSTIAERYRQTAVAGIAQRTHHLFLAACLTRSAANLDHDTAAACAAILLPRLGDSPDAVEVQLAVHLCARGDAYPELTDSLFAVRPETIESGLQMFPHCASFEWLRPRVERMRPFQGPLLHLLVPDIMFDAARDDGNATWTINLLRALIGQRQWGLNRRRDVRQRFFAALNRAPMPGAKATEILALAAQIYVDRDDDPPDERARPCDLAALLTAAGPEWTLPVERQVIELTSSRAPDVRLAAYRALAARDPAEHLCAWLLYETPFDPDPRVRSLRLPSR